MHVQPVGLNAETKKDRHRAEGERCLLTFPFIGLVRFLAFIGTRAIGSEFADNFHRTDLLSMGDLRLTPEGNCF